MFSTVVSDTPSAAAGAVAWEFEDGLPGQLNLGIGSFLVQPGPFS